MDKKCFVCVVLAAGTLASCRPAVSPLRFEDVTQREGVARYVDRWRVGHGAGWGDADGDGRPDLYIGAFADRYRQMSDPPIPNQLFLNTGEGFVLSPEQNVRLDDKRWARTASAIFVDLDNDGDLDLFVATHGEISRDKPDNPQSVLFENLGGGRFRDATPAEGRGDWPRPLGARNVGTVDIDSDGLLDLVVCDGNYGNWEDGRGRLIILRNKGDWTFQDVGSSRYGLPSDGTPGMGLAMGDVNDDGVFDFFVADANRMFVSTPGGTFRECQPQTFALPNRRYEQRAAPPTAEPRGIEGGSSQREDNQPPRPPEARRDGRGRRGSRPRDERPRGEALHSVGAAFGDLNGDGLLDLVVTEHIPGAYLHVYLNKGIRDGMPRFEEISKQIGLGEPFVKEGMTGVVVKSGHVAIRDVDNDGRNDVMLALVCKDAEGSVQPFVLWNGGNEGPLPRLVGPPQQRLLGYYAPAPVADYDRDGRVDIFLASWFDELPNYLFRNVTEGGHWLTVRVVGQGPGLNPMGVGSVVRVYQAGRAGSKSHLIGRFDVAIGTGYSSGEQALAHVGLGKHQTCDVQVTWGQRKVTRANVAADQAVEVIFR